MNKDTCLPHRPVCVDKAQSVFSTKRQEWTRKNPRASPGNKPSPEEVRLKGFLCWLRGAIHALNQLEDNKRGFTSLSYHQIRTREKVLLSPPYELDILIFQGDYLSDEASIWKSQLTKTKERFEKHFLAKKLKRTPISSEECGPKSTTSVRHWISWTTPRTC